MRRSAVFGIAKCDLSLLSFARPLQRKKFFYTMSTEALFGLLEYLRETLSIDNRKWLAERLVVSDESYHQLTMDEIRDRINQSERDLAEGNVHTNDEMISFMNDYLQNLKKSI